MVCVTAHGGLEWDALLTKGKIHSCTSGMRQNFSKKNHPILGTPQLTAEQKKKPNSETPKLLKTHRSKITVKKGEFFFWT